MASIKLQPCKLRDGWFVPIKTEAVLEVDWNGLCERVAPSRTKVALQALGRLEASAYVGLRKLATGQLSLFVLRNPDLSGDARRLAKANPFLEEQLVSLFRVDAVQWDRTMQEAESKPDLPPSPTSATKGVLVQTTNGHHRASRSR